MGRYFRLGYHGGGTTFAPSDIAGLELYLDASSESAYSDGDDVTTPTELSGEVNSFTQGTAANKPHWRNGANGIGGVAAFEFDGVQQRWETVAMAVGSGNKTVVVVVNPSTTTGRYFDSETGRLICGDNTDNVGWYDGAWDEIAPATTVAQVLTWVLNSTGTNGRLYRNHTLLGVATAYTALAISGSSSIGSREDGAAPYLSGLMGMIAVYDNAISDSDRFSLVSGLMSKWGIS